MTRPSSVSDNTIHDENAQRAFPRNLDDLNALLEQHHSPLGLLLKRAAEMPAPTTTLVIDTETTGLSPFWDQIVQVGAIRANASLEIAHPERDVINLRCRLRPEVIPAPQALLTTRTVPAMLVHARMSHGEIMQRAEAFVMENAPSIIVGHNIVGFDSEHLRHNFFSALLPAYGLHQCGNRVVDTMVMARLVRLLDPGAMVWPVNAKGVISFRLSDLCRVNGITLGDDAHDALADARATLDLLRLMKSASPMVHALAVALGDKAFVRSVLDESQLLGLVSKWGEPRIEPVVHITDDPINRNAAYLGKLAQERIITITEPGADMRAMMTGKECVIRKVKINAMPLVLPLDLADPLLPAGFVNLGDIDPDSAIDTLQIRAWPITTDDNLHKAVRRASEAIAAERPVSEHVEERLYVDGFPSDSDLRVCRQLLAAAPSKKAALLPCITDQRLFIHAVRYVHDVAPETLPENQRALINEWLRLRLMSDGDCPWLTIPRALDAIESLRDGIADNARRLAAETFPDPFPIGHDDTGAPIFDEDGIRIAAELRDEHFEQSTANEFTILDAYADWLLERMNAVDPVGSRQHFARRLAKWSVQP